MELLFLGMYQSVMNHKCDVLEGNAFLRDHLNKYYICLKVLPVNHAIFSLFGWWIFAYKTVTSLCDIFVYSRQSSC